MADNNGNGKPAGALLGLHALTSLHPGSGTALGVVDLPVQRERHTQWPTIAGSALKGILRDAYREHLVNTKGADSRKAADGDDKLTRLFGPPTQEADKHAGALSVTDARLLAFPVRSLKGVFAWVTCPAVLERLQRDAALAGVPAGWAIPPVTGNQVIVPKECPCLIDKDKVVLEEFDFTVAGGNVTPIAEWVTAHALPSLGGESATKARFQKQMLVLSDDDFTHFVRHATEVQARIGLNYDTKTAQDGALFYQEFLPPETLFYSVVLANPSRNGQAAGAAELLQSVKDFLPAVLQIGGDETTGKGLCAVRLNGKGV